MDKIGLESARSRTVKTFDDAMAALDIVGLPAIIRPSFTLGGEGAVLLITALNLSKSSVMACAFLLCQKF